MNAINKTIFLLIVLAISACKDNKSAGPKNAIFKMGFQTASSSTGPLDNSAFVLKLNDTLPALLITAHHTVAGTGTGDYVRWDKIGHMQKDAWAWSMHDSTFNFKVGNNLPIRDAETLKLDIAAFHLADKNIPHLKPAKQKALVGDTVYLYSQITYQNKTSLLNRAVVVYATDSVMAYELTDFYMARVIGGTSGSCVLNKDGDVVSNSYAGFTIANEQVKKEMALMLPLLNKLETKEGKTYGVGVPIGLISASLMNAFHEQYPITN